MVTIGILGVAHPNVDSYLQNLRQAGASVAGVHDPDRVRAAWWGRANGVQIFPSAEALTALVDGVIICAETALRGEMAGLAASAGVAALCETPLDVTEEGSRMIVEECAQARVSLMPAFPVRFEPTMLQVRDLIARGDLGRIRALSGVNHTVMPVRDRSWFADPTLSGGGAMMDNITYLADVYSWILGVEPDDVYAVANRVLHPGVVTVETAGLVIVSYPAGVFGSIDCSWSRPLNYPTRGEFSVSAVGDGGTVDFDSKSQRLNHFGGPQKYSWVGWGQDANQPMIQEFLDCIAERRPPAVDGSDALRATKVALAALESFRLASPVRIPRAEDEV